MQMNNEILDYEVEDSNLPIGPPSYVGFWVRAIAVIVDGICLLPFKYLGSMDIEIPIVLILITLAYPIYKIGMEHYFGATLGKMAMHIKVVNEDGDKPNIGEAITRNIFWLIPALTGVLYQVVPELSHQFSIPLAEGVNAVETLGLISVIVVIFHAKKQALHDMMAGSFVVYKMVG